MATFADLPGETSRLSEEAGESELQFAAEDATEYKNKKSDLDIRFSKKTKENNMVKLGKGQSKISWGFAGTNKSRIRIEDVSQETLSGNDAFMSLPNLTQTVTYPEAYAGVDLQYIVSSVGIKENIILKNAQAKRSYSVEYRMKGLTPVQVDEKTIALRDKNGNDVYTLTAPMMADAAGAMSTDVALSLTEAKNNKFTVQLSVDEEWIADATRVFPVVIDPDIQTSQADKDVKAVYVDASSPTKAWGETIGSVYVGSQYISSKGSCYKARTLVKATKLPSLGVGYVVVGAQLNLRQNSISLDAKMKIEAHEITSAWDYSTATWNNQPSCSSTVVDYMKLDGKSNPDKNYRFWDITSSVKKWYENSSTNLGLMLKSPVESSGAANCAMFASPVTKHRLCAPVNCGRLPQREGL